MMSSSPSDLSFLSVLSSTPSNDMGLDTTYSFSPDADFGDLMMSPFMKHSQDFNVSMNSMLTSTTLPTIMPVVNLPPLSPESDNGSFAESVMSSSSSQPTTTSQQRSSIISDNEYHSPHDEPLSPLPDDYFTNMAQLQAQAQQQAQQQVQQQQQTTSSVQQQQGKPVVSILHTTPPTTPTEKPTLLNHLSVSIPPSTTSIPTSTTPETKPTKKRKSRTVKVEPTTPEEDTHEDDEPDVAIDPNLPPDVIRELLQEQSLKKKRLARKAELARMSRKRKKTRMGDLELECERLHAEIDRLRKMRRLDMEDAANKQQQAVAAATASAQAAAATTQQQNQMIKEEDGKFIFDSRRWIDVSDHQKAVADTIQSMADAARTVQGQEDTTYMGKLHETFVQTFNRQMVAGEGHIAALENHLSPCMPLQFLQWVMSQPDKFCQDTSGLWNSLFQAEIGVTTDQMKEIMALRTTVKKQRKVNVDVEKAYKKLSHCLRRQMSQSNENLTKLRSILSPLQLAKYFDWVNRFGHVCVKINL